MKVFVSCQLDFEEVLKAEVQNFWPRLLGPDSRPQTEPLPEILVQPGGLEFEASLLQAVQLNFFLKTAHRILARVHIFRCRDFPKLFEEIQKINWSQWVDLIPTEIRVEASGSRLNHEKRILETIQSAFKKVKSLKEATPDQKTPTLFVRIYDDQVTLSFDLSGEHLHKRGYGLLKGEAPLRETLAAGLLRLSLPFKSEEVQTLWDPFCGSGTFLFEAQMLNHGPLQRGFDFKLLKNSPKIFKTDLWAKNYKDVTKNLFQKYLGSDLNSQVLDLAKLNHQKLSEQYPQAAQPILWLAQDFESAPVQRDPCFVIMNPPYGERLEGLSGNWKEILEGFLQQQKAVRLLGLLLPSRQQPQNVKGFQQVLTHRFKTGGLPVQYSLWKKS